jgi:hypothetical protein
MDQSLHPYAVNAQCSIEGAPPPLTGCPGLSPYRTTEGSQARLLAHTFLVKAGERALFELLCSLGEARNSEEVRAGLQAADLVREALRSWREDLGVLRAITPGGIAGRNAQLLPLVHRR